MPENIIELNKTKLETLFEDNVSEKYSNDEVLSDNIIEELFDEKPKFHWNIE